MKDDAPREATVDAPMAPWVRDALHFYTSPAGNYLRINKAFRSGTIDEVETIAPDSSLISRALAELEKFEGPVFRRIADDLPVENIERYSPGVIIVENGYTSATMDPQFSFGSGNVQWVIVSKSGRIVDSHSAVPWEREVAFDRFTKFEVLERYYDSDEGCWMIAMSEV
ncbi:MAG: hypothetical protein ITG02_00880 [Patulibacter sp.]|nr:hypothetical protein [Patulibacter sp.]